MAERSSIGSCHCRVLLFFLFMVQLLWLISASALLGKQQDCPFRSAPRWLTTHRAANGHSVDELPFRATFGVWGSYVCLLINILALMGQFYVALYPVGGPNLNANTFFQAYLAGPLFIFLYLCWKVYSWFVRPADRPLFIRTKDIDIYTGMRDTQSRINGVGISEEQRRASIQEMQDERRKRGPKDLIMAVVRSII